MNAMKGLLLAQFLLSCARFAFSVVTPTIDVPSPIYDNSTQRIEVKCRFSGQTRDIALDYIKIDFKKASGNTRELARVIGSSPTIIDPALTSRATVTGNINTGSTTSSYLILDITNVSCVEVGTYTCKTRYQHNSTVSSPQVSKVVEGRSYPAELEVIHDPVKNKYAIGETMTMTCSGKVGKPANNWFWAKYNEQSKLWEPIVNDVTETSAVVVSDCAFSRSSTLTFVIPDDMEHKFRCTAGSSVDYSVFTSVNGKVGGAASIAVSSLLMWCSLLYTIWQS